MYHSVNQQRQLPKRMADEIFVMAVERCEDFSLRKPCVLLLLLAFILAPSALYAQANAVDAAVNGYVYDPAKGAVAHAHSTLTNVSTGVTQQSESDSNGYYRFPLVPVGVYRLSVTAPGFNTFVQDKVVLNVGQEARLDVTLPVGNASETVNVEASASIVDTGTSTVGAVLDQSQIENLPLASRQVYNYLLLAPGVIGVPTSTFSTTLFAFGGFERSQWNVDGLDDTQHGSNRQIRLVIVTPDAIAETQTLSSGYSAEFGRAAGGQINVVLKSGTNQFHGSALGQWRPTSLQAIPTLLKQQPDRTWNDQSYSLGGPILHNRLFFFGQFENNPYTLPAAITITQANAAALGLAGSQIGSAPFGETYRSLVGKADFQLNAKNSGFVQYIRFTNHQPNTASGLSIIDRGSRTIDHQNGAGAQLATVISPHMLNELRFGAIQRDTGSFPETGCKTDSNALINITSTANIGCSTLTTTTTTERSSTVLDNVTLTRGIHTIKFGGEFDHELFANLSSTAPTFTFDGIAASRTTPAVSALQVYLNTLAGTINPLTNKLYTYTALTAFGGDPAIRIAFNFIDGFVQDEVRFNEHVTLNAGARYEVILFPTFDAQAPYALSRSVPNDYSNIAPRFGLSWSPGDGHTVVHAAFGMYYDTPGLSTFYSAGQINGHRLLQYTVQGTAAGAPTFPTVPQFAGSANLVAPSITAFDQSFHNAYQLQADLQVEHQLSSHTTVIAGYQFAGLRHGLYAADTNLTPAGTFLPDGRPIYQGTGKRPNKSFGAINVIHSGVSGSFNGGFVSLQQKLQKGLELTANYEYSHALSDNIGEGGIISDPSNLQRDYGNAESDVRHNFTFQGIYTTQFQQRRLRWLSNFELSALTFLNSGFPVNPLAGVDLNNNGVSNDRPLFVSRNSLHVRGLHELEMQAKRSFNIGERFRLAVFVVSENLTNSNNLNCNTTSGCSSAVINTVNSSAFLAEQSARTSRNVQVGGSIHF